MNTIVKRPSKFAMPSMFGLRKVDDFRKLGQHCDTLQNNTIWKTISQFAYYYPNMDDTQYAEFKEEAQFQHRRWKRDELNIEGFFRINYISREYEIAERHMKKYFSTHRKLLIETFFHRIFKDNKKISVFHYSQEDRNNEKELILILKSIAETNLIHDNIALVNFIHYINKNLFFSFVDKIPIRAVCSKSGKKADIIHINLNASHWTDIDRLKKTKFGKNGYIKIEPINPM
jgi:hypothetical protein